MRVKSVVFAMIAGACVFLTGCSSGTSGTDKADAAASAPDENRETPQSGADASKPPAPPESPAPEAVRYESLDETDGEFRFSYNWPAQVTAIPALSAMLTKERSTLYDEWQAKWTGAKKDVPSDCQACRTYSYGKDWQVVTDIERYLSLSAQVTTYTGGAHGMLVFDSAVFDRKTGALLDPVNMFRSKEALNAAVKDAFCAQLDRGRAKKRGGRDIGGTFSECIEPVANSAVILGSASGQRFDRIGFLIPPYNAGPYAEGSYEVTLNLTPAILDAVRPEYRRSFQVP